MACADAYFEDKDYFVWSSNQISAWVGLTAAGMDYFRNAEMVHPWIRDYCKNTARYHEPGKWRGLGICMMDYAGARTYVGWSSTLIYGDELVNALIDLNF